jgi:hypothetical protein
MLRLKAVAIRTAAKDQSGASIHPGDIADHGRDNDEAEQIEKSA